MTTLQSRAASVDEVLITHELARRTTRPPQYEAENRALAALAGEMTANPHGVLLKLAELVVELTQADSAGLSILETTGEAEVFRWKAIAGQLAVDRDRTMLREESPCGVAISRNTTLLFSQAERFFPALRDVDPPIHENLLVPWTVGGKAIGTLWAMAHSPGKKFDAEDARLLGSLVSFASAACQMSAALDQAKENRQELERRVEERTCSLSATNERLQREIEQRREIERTLQESEARFRALADASPALIWQVDTEGDVVFLNQYGIDTIGLGQEELFTAGWPAFVHPDDLPGYLGLLEKALYGHGALQLRARIKARDGQWRWYETHAAPWFTAESNYAGHVGISIDVTEAVKGEEALRDADRRKDEFLATLAHELRNPLAPISNAIQLMRRPDGRRISDSLVEMVARQVQQVVRLVDDLMDISRITRGKIELDVCPIALSDVVQNAVEMSKPLIDRGSHHLTISLPEQAVIFEADSVRLTQILANLLNNAAKYMDAGGHIWLTARVDAKEIAISVRDTGIGIPGNELPRIFDMFTQLPRTTGRNYGGLGIGLTMVRSLVEMHGGSVEARSQGPGHGSEFIVHLPALRAPHDEDGAQRTAAGDQHLRGQRILVVDDNRDAADSLTLLLEANGAEVQAVYDSLIAVAAVERFRPDTVLLDLGMPGLSGYEVAQQIREDLRFQSIRIVALTGWGLETDRIRTRESGFDYHLTKPVEFGALEAWLSGRSRAP